MWVFGGMSNVGSETRREKDERVSPCVVEIALVKGSGRVQNWRRRTRSIESTQGMRDKRPLRQVEKRGASMHVTKALETGVDGETGPATRSDATWTWIGMGPAEDVELV